MRVTNPEHVAKLEQDTLAFQSGRYFRRWFETDQHFRCLEVSWFGTSNLSSSISVFSNCHIRSKSRCTLPTLEKLLVSACAIMGTLFYTPACENSTQTMKMLASRPGISLVRVSAMRSRVFVATEEMKQKQPVVMVSMQSERFHMRDFVLWRHMQDEACRVAHTRMAGRGGSQKSILLDVRCDPYCLSALSTKSNVDSHSRAELVGMCSMDAGIGVYGDDTRQYKFHEKLDRRSPPMFVPMYYDLHLMLCHRDPSTRDVTILNPTSATAFLDADRQDDIKDSAIQSVLRDKVGGGLDRDKYHVENWYRYLGTNNELIGIDRVNSLAKCRTDVPKNRRCTDNRSWVNGMLEAMRMEVSRRMLQARARYEDVWKGMASALFPDAASVEIRHLDVQGHNDCGMWVWLIPCYLAQKQNGPLAAGLVRTFGVDECSNTAELLYEFAKDFEPFEQVTPTARLPLVAAKKRPVSVSHSEVLSDPCPAEGLAPRAPVSVRPVDCLLTVAQSFRELGFACVGDHVEENIELREKGQGWRMDELSERLRETGLVQVFYDRSKVRPPSIELVTWDGGSDSTIAIVRSDHLEDVFAVAGSCCRRDVRETEMEYFSGGEPRCVRERLWMTVHPNVVRDRNLGKLSRSRILITKKGYTYVPSKKRKQNSAKKSYC